jgi:PEP-CTERM motif-containing protein
VFVSYRVGNRIYWTKNKTLVPRGEMLITDGTHFARTRCGNRISERPMGPVSPAEPTAKTLDEPSRPNVPVIPLEPYDLPALWESEETPPWLPLAPGPAVPGGGIYVPPIPPFFCCSGGGSAPVPVTPAPLQAPEPATLLLVLLGLGAASLLRKK